MTCARQRRLEEEAHLYAVQACCESAEDFDLHLCCCDEGRCTDERSCTFFVEALAQVTAFEDCLL